MPPSASPARASATAVASQLRAVAWSKGSGVFMSSLSCGRNTRATCGKYSPGSPQPDELSGGTMPALTLREILALDPVRASEPELLAGHTGLDRPVRWVHSSEVYEGAN